MMFKEQAENCRRQAWNMRAGQKHPSCSASPVPLRIWRFAPMLERSLRRARPRRNSGRAFPLKPTSASYGVGWPSRRWRRCRKSNDEQRDRRGDRVGNPILYVAVAVDGRNRLRELDEGAEEGQAGEQPPQRRSGISPCAERGERREGQHVLHLVVGLPGQLGRLGQNGHDEGENHRGPENEFRKACEVHARCLAWARGRSSKCGTERLPTLSVQPGPVIEWTEMNRSSAIRC